MGKEREQEKAQRRVLAKQRRLEEQRRRIRRARVRRIRNAAIVLVLIAGVSAFVVINNRRGAQATRRLNDLALAAGCSSLQTPAVEGSTHVEAPTRVTYKTDPPTSGDMYGGTGPTGISSQPLQDENQVHNLEHGHIGIQYSDKLAGEMVDRLRDVVRENPTRTFMAPRPTMPAQLALTAWGRLLTCDQPTEAALEVARAFQKQFAGKGAEGDAPQPPQGV